MPDEIRLHPRALAAYRRAEGRIRSDAPLVEAPGFMAPPRDRRGLPMHYFPPRPRSPLEPARLIMERAGALVHSTLSIAGLRPARGRSRQPEIRPRQKSSADTQSELPQEQRNYAELAPWNQNCQPMAVTEPPVIRTACVRSPYLAGPNGVNSTDGSRETPGGRQNTLPFADMHRQRTEWGVQGARRIRDQP